MPRFVAQTLRRLRGSLERRRGGGIRFVSTKVNRPKSEQHERIAQQRGSAVARRRDSARYSRTVSVVDVAVAAPVEITRRRVVERVIAAPLAERRHRQHAGDPPETDVRALRRRNEPCAQSCMMMNVRTSRSPVGMPRAGTSQTEI